MPTGTGTFVPNGKFACPRSYWRGIAHNIAGYTVANVGNVYTWTKNTDPNEVWTIGLDMRFYPWSSNRWTLDHIVTDFYYTIAPSPTQHPQPYTLYYFIRPGHPSPYIQIRFNNVDFGNLVYFDFPGAPGSYWLPPFL
jgi:hypothetical protein